ncbi:hypothetical protein GLAREA_02998 [Glarea lozoyensis ATCC 20868]|uniref:Uncharacterized protein n=1 Tax=Glarea lozoyensis (strain ATCC 20868 / MF5171) TaxID=1116229 RepID=S3CPL3_GLAL2|nr:uncharacterized protein GLAREA_02998 [Glarea lozoyensis ATCC 20868]EPE27084.1 hypothetical protein GLAREA_02998 [Glarea lozoyensis ATCC 20868]
MSPVTRLVNPIMETTTKIARCVSEETTPPKSLNFRQSADLWFSNNWIWFLLLLILTVITTCTFVVLYCRSLLRINLIKREMKKGNWSERRAGDVEDGNSSVQTPESSTDSLRLTPSVSSAGKPSEEHTDRKWWSRKKPGET